MGVQWRKGNGVAYGLLPFHNNNLFDHDLKKLFCSAVVFGVLKLMEFIKQFVQISATAYNSA